MEFNHWTGEHSSPLRLGFLSLIWNLHPNNAFPFEKLRIFRDGGPRQRWMRCWNLTDGRTGEHSSPLRFGNFNIDLESAPQQCLLLPGEGGPRQRWMRCWDYINGKNQQHRRAGACSCRFVWDYIIEKTGEHTSPYDWFFVIVLKSAPQQTPPTLIVGQGLAPAVSFGI